MEWVHFMVLTLILFNEKYTYCFILSNTAEKGIMRPHMSWHVFKFSKTRFISDSLSQGGAVQAAEQEQFFMQMCLYQFKLLGGQSLQRSQVSFHKPQFRSLFCSALELQQQHPSANIQYNPSLNRISYYFDLILPVCYRILYCRRFKPREELWRIYFAVVMSRRL